MEQHGDAKLTDLLQTLANCVKARSASRGRDADAGSTTDVYSQLSAITSVLRKLRPPNRRARPTQTQNVTRPSGHPRD
jgi:hypothetical protein